MALELRQVTVAAGAARLIEDVTLSLKAGRLTVILGANGAGKSTTLNVAAGDLRPSSGEALLDGLPIARMAARDLARRRAVVLQHTPVNFNLAVHEIVALARAPFSGPPSAFEANEERALRSLDLLGFAGRDYATLSGGERQRVQIARALAQLWHAGEEGGGRYLLMDEPTAHLDLKHQITALEAARRFADEGGAVLCILHDLALAGEFADHVVLMKRGRVVAQGAAKALLTPETIADAYEISPRRAGLLCPAA